MKKIMISLSILGVILITSTAAFAMQKPLDPTIKEKNLTLEVGSSKKQLIQLLEKNSSFAEDIQVDSSSFNPSKLGKDEVDVQMENFLQQKDKQEVSISIVDTKKPTIESKETLTIPVAAKMDLKNYIKTIDNYDKKPIITIDGFNPKKLGKQEVTIVAKDQSNNTTKKTITVNLVDKTAPTIKGATLTYKEGETINKLANLSVTDNFDGNLIKKVKTKGDVNNQKPGTYTVTYAVADTSGNKTTFKRNIIVQAPDAPVATNTTEVVAAEPENTTSATQPTNNEQTATTQASVEIQPETPTTKTEPSTPTYAPMTLTLAGTTIPYQNGGQGAGQSIIDANPYGVASTWGGAAVQSGNDGLNTHFIGHSPGIFSVLFNLGGGSPIVVTDANGTPTTYYVTSVLQVNDNAFGVNDNVDYWDTITGTGGGERITLQACVNDAINLIVIAQK